MARIVVAMSGGVDSSVTAALLHAQGHDVIGVTLDVWPSETPQAQRQRKACCGTSAVEDARRVADRLGIPYYVLNFRELFRETVIADFVREYQRGRRRTPNPCVRCNQHVKFRPVLARAAILGADYVATGHYVRREQDARTGRYVLRRAQGSWEGPVLRLVAGAAGRAGPHAFSARGHRQAGSTRVWHVPLASPLPTSRRARRFALCRPAAIAGISSRWRRRPWSRASCSRPRVRCWASIPGRGLLHARPAARAGLPPFAAHVRRGHPARAQRRRRR